MAGLKFLLDTNILSEPLVKHPNSGVMAKIQAHSSAVCLASVTWQEMLYGMYLMVPGKRRERIQDYLLQRIRPGLPIIDFNADAAHW